MPQALQVTLEPTLGDFVELTRTDGYKEVESTLGYGRLVVTTAKKNELVATGQWTDVTPS
jgi:hypothetical protein